MEDIKEKKEMYVARNDYLPSRRIFLNSSSLSPVNYLDHFLFLIVFHQCEKMGKPALQVQLYKVF